VQTSLLRKQPAGILRLDPGFSPIILAISEFESQVRASQNPEPVTIALERTGSQVYRTDRLVFNDSYEHQEDNFLYIERLIKTLLWLKGGYRLYLYGPEELTARIKRAYEPGGIREFDRDFMSEVYDSPFEVLICYQDEIPDTNEKSRPIGRHLDGCRIGFDAGGSDRKVSAVRDGEAIYSEEVVWHPKLHADPEYHIDGVLDSLNRAAAKLPKVDAIGVSSAGIFIDNRIAVASLFRSVPKPLFDQKIRNMYLEIQKQFGMIPLEVVNDGDVTALAGAMSLNENRVLGLAMGTSEAAGYVDKDGNITGWLNELSFVPLDLNPGAMVDEWSQDSGVGSSYLSQDAVIKLAKPAHIDLDDNLSPAEKLAHVQKLAESNDEMAKEIFRTIGCYLGYAIAYYESFYSMKHVLVLGRVTSGLGGSLIISEANRILKTEFPDLNRKLRIALPDEKSRRVGQSIAAASLPEIKKVGI